MVQAKTDNIDWTKNAMNQCGDNLVGSEATHTVANGATYWFTGLSGAGKSTLSSALKVKID